MARKPDGLYIPIRADLSALKADLSRMKGLAQEHAKVMADSLCKVRGEQAHVAVIALVCILVVGVVGLVALAG
ncbi:hypothetical protein [Bilophila wadsworthia]|uniref:hypothetical protein n=1 Tax=Bilophila wadsworthia TaxID=35833 RepID=UPI0024305367|nr:hypothetical protein [Bilophila wadsworthia]